MLYSRRQSNSAGIKGYPDVNRTRELLSTVEKPVVIEAPKQDLKTVKETSESKVALEFVDVDRVSQEGVNKIDLDKVILTDLQKKDLIAQMRKSKQFWVLFIMQACSILFAYYVVDVYKSFGLSVP